jgi:GWxTD domain-containing protein
MRILFLTAALVAAATQPSLAMTTGLVPRAEALYRSAVLDLGRNTIDTRRRAIASLEQATILDPSNPSYELLLARAYYQCGFLQLSKQRFERIEKLLPADADGHFGLGLAWRRDWLKYLERKSLVHAIDEFREAGNLRPTMTDAWLELVPLLVERNDLAGASNAADQAFAADPKRPEALLARAECAYRRGDVRLADSLFRAAVPRLPRLARERFDDISPVATERDTFALHRLPAAAQREFVSRFWRDNDPDLSSVENEAMLEYWSRVAQAYFLYFDAHRREWDERGEVYVRYGPPTAVSYNPVGMRLSYQFGVDVRGGSVVSMGTGPPYPMNALVWSYPELGMDVVMQDRMLSEYYLLPITRDFDPDPVPNPAALERQPTGSPSAAAAACSARCRPASRR